MKGSSAGSVPTGRGISSSNSTVHQIESYRADEGEGVGIQESLSDFVRLRPYSMKGGGCYDEKDGQGACAGCRRDCAFRLGGVRELPLRGMSRKQPMRRAAVWRHNRRHTAGHRRRALGTVTESAKRNVENTIDPMKS